MVILRWIAIFYRNLEVCKVLTSTSGYDSMREVARLWVFRTCIALWNMLEPRKTPYQLAFLAIYRMGIYSWPLFKLSPIGEVGAGPAAKFIVDRT
jgi:hypothetical protein